MQFHSPTNTQPQHTRNVTPSPKLQKLQFESNDAFDSPTKSKFEESIKNCKTVKEFGRLIKANGKILKSPHYLRAALRKLGEFKTEMNSRDVAILLHVFSKSNFASKVVDLYRAILTLLSDQALVTLHEASAKDVSMTLHALVKRHVGNAELFRKAAEHGVTVIEDFNPEGLSNMLLALAKTNSYSFEFFDRAAKIAASTMQNKDFNSQSLCFVVDAFTRTNHYDRELFLAIERKAIPFLDTFRPQDMNLLIGAFANSEHDCKDLFDAASKTIMHKVEYFNTMSLCHFANSFAKCGYKNPDLLDTIAEKEILFLHTLDAWPMSELLSVFVNVDYVHEALFQAAKSAVVHRMPSYEPNELITITCAFSKVESFDMADVFTAAAEAAELILDTFQPQEVANLLEIFSTIESFSESSDHLFCMIASLVLSNPYEIDRWDSRNLVDVAVAFAKGGVTNTNLLEVIGRTIMERGDLFPPYGTRRKTIQRLLAAFVGYETPSAVVVMELVFREFASLDKSQIEFSFVMQIAKALPYGQRNGILPYGIFKQISDIALAEGNEAEVSSLFRCYAQLGFEGLLVSSKRGGSEGNTDQE